jgi:electron transfer flavoprotein alpha subunit
MEETKDVLVFLEPFGETGHAVNQGLLTEGRRIADALGGSLLAMAVGPFTEGTPVLEGYGVMTLIHAEADALIEYSPEAFARAAASVLEGVSFRLLLFAHSDRGADLAPRIAFALGKGAVTDCVDIGVRDGTLFYVRSVYGDQLHQEVSYRVAGGEIASLTCSVLDEGRPGMAAGPVEVCSVAVQVPPDCARSTVVSVMPPDYRTVDIAFAKRIIGAGSGCGDPELMGLVEELSHLIEGSVAATRPVVDEGLLPKERMIGQTGKTVAPEVYLALGISGSPHHVAGIQRSKTILAVNRDQRAPIFNLADAGFAGDLRSLLPRLIDRIKQYRDGSP